MRPSARQHTPAARRRRRGAAAFAALLLAGSLGMAGCSASPGADKASAPANGSRSEPSAGRVGSGNADSRAVQEGGDSSSTGTPAAGSGSSKKPSLAPTYLVRTAELDIRTTHVPDAVQQAKTLAAGEGGYAGDEDTAVDAAGHATSTIKLSVPPARYDQLLDDLGKLGTLLGRKVSVSDVTSQVVDVQSRVKSQQASVDRVRKLMDQASGLSDVVSLESELSSREAALESLEAQQASLQARTNLATITLRLTEPPVKAAAKKPRSKHDGFGTTVGNALGGGWHAFYVTVRTVLVVVSAILPFLAVVALIWFGYRLMRRRWPRAARPDVPPSTLRAPDGLPKHPQRNPQRQDDPWTAPPASREAPQGAVWAPRAPAAPPLPQQAQQAQPKEQDDDPGRAQEPPVG